MASYIPNSSHRLNERPHTPKQDTGSASIAPVHRYLTTNPVGRQYTASEYSMRRGHPVGSSSAEEYEGDLSLWQLEGNVDGMLTPARRVCHVCGVRVTPQLSCPSCGHPMCGSCGPEVVKARGLRGEDEMGVDKVKKAGQPGSVVCSLPLVSERGINIQLMDLLTYWAKRNTIHSSLPTR